NREFIALYDEVEYISQYIDLQKLRLNDYADVEFSHREENALMPVPPMMLITFVENAFKYGVSANDPCFIHIALTQHDDKIVFEVENSVFEREVKNSKRMGIENCRRRLGLLYPERHNLEFGSSEDGKTYKVRLELHNQNVI
ncbi:MAG: sensor histidine kinase, partial [Muribaculaceae bacterium]